VHNRPSSGKSTSSRISNTATIATSIDSNYIMKTRKTQTARINLDRFKIEQITLRRLKYPNTII
jgi:hypothetical protein